MFSNPSKCDGYKPDNITYELRLRCEHTTTDTRGKRVYVRHRSSLDRKQGCQLAALRYCHGQSLSPSDAFFFYCILLQTAFSNFAKLDTRTLWVLLTPHNEVESLIPELN